MPSAHYMYIHIAAESNLNNRFDDFPKHVRSRRGASGEAILINIFHYYAPHLTSPRAAIFQ
jgi:hypothetical protein